MNHAPFIAYHGFDPVTGKYIGKVAAYVDPLESTEDEAIYNAPANAIKTAPDGELTLFQGFKINANRDDWDRVDDYSECQIWDTTTGQPAASPAFGEPLPEKCTLQPPPPHEPGETLDWDSVQGWSVRPAPPSKLHKWDGREWVLDDDARIQLAIIDANTRLLTDRAALDAAIAPLQDAVELEMATDTERERLIELKRRRVLLSRIQEQPGYPLQIVWPG